MPYLYQTCSCCRCRRSRANDCLTRQCILLIMYSRWTICGKSLIYATSKKGCWTAGLCTLTGSTLRRPKRTSVASTNLKRLKLYTTKKGVQTVYGHLSFPDKEPPFYLFIPFHSIFLISFSLIK